MAEKPPEPEQTPQPTSPPDSSADPDNAIADASEKPTVARPDDEDRAKASDRLETAEGLAGAGLSIAGCLAYGLYPFFGIGLIIIILLIIFSIVN